jgi:hypothetical protein
VARKIAARDGSNRNWLQRSSDRLLLPIAGLLWDRLQVVGHELILVGRWTGVERASVVPSPSSPTLLSPQQPSANSAQVWWPTAINWTAPVRPGMAHPNRR